jgi:hypothetical protein
MHPHLRRNFVIAIAKHDPAIVAPSSPSNGPHQAVRHVDLPDDWATCALVRMMTLPAFVF